MVLRLLAALLLSSCARSERDFTRKLLLEDARSLLVGTDNTSLGVLAAESAQRHWHGGTDNSSLGVLAVDGVQRQWRGGTDNSSLGVLAVDSMQRQWHGGTDNSSLGVLAVDSMQRQWHGGADNSSLGVLAAHVGSGRRGVKLDSSKLDSHGPDAVELGQAIVEAASLPGTWTLVSEVHVSDYSSAEELEHVRTSCACPLAKDLGDAADSSASGATFWNCNDPVEKRFPRMLVKGYVRDGEFKTFTELLGPLKTHFKRLRSTLLNKIVLGFKAFGKYWLVLQDVKAKPVMEHLEAGGIEAESEVDWSAFDIKPTGNRSPMSPECFQRLRLLEEVFGPVDEFDNWPLVWESLQGDTVELAKHGVIDESLLVQVAGPFRITTDSGQGRANPRISAVFSDVPVCAYRIHGQLMAVVCVSILDYLLTYGTMERLQNTAQWGRWTDYEEKLLSLAECIGEVQQHSCVEFQDMADEAWRKLEMQRYAKMLEDPYQREYVETVKQHFRCCCYTGGGMKSTIGVTGKLKWSTPCEWQAYMMKLYRPKTTNAGFCSNNAVHWDPSSGGCARIEMPDVGRLLNQGLVGLLD